MANISTGANGGKVEKEQRLTGRRPSLVNIATLVSEPPLRLFLGAILPQFLGVYDLSPVCLMYLLFKERSYSQLEPSLGFVSCYISRVCESLYFEHRIEPFTK